MASYNGERCIRLWELPSFEARGTLGDVNNARAMAGAAGWWCWVFGQWGLGGAAGGQGVVWVCAACEGRRQILFQRPVANGACCAHPWAAPAGSATAQLVFSGDEHGRVKVYKWKAIGPGGFPIQ